MNVEHIIKAAIPDANESMIHYILWDRTPFPVGKVNPRMIYKAASTFHRAITNGRRLCDFCSNEVKNNDYKCPKCKSALALAAKIII